MPARYATPPIGGLFLVLIVLALSAGVLLMPTDETSTAGGPPQFRLAHLMLSGSGQ